MPRYATDTSVSVEKSRNEIERTLRRYGCDEFGYAAGPRMATIGFRMNSLNIRFTLPIPDLQAKEFTHTEGRGLRRSVDAQMAAWEQACRQRWRALALVVKAKLEAVDAGIVTFEEEFLAHVVTETGETVGERLVPQLPQIARGAVPMLPAPSAGAA